jgi:predicted nucleic acid-binding protein
MIVVDTNIIGYLYLSSDRSGQAEKALLIDSEWVAPILWRSEFHNVLTLYIRKNILTLEDAVRIMDQATLLMQVVSTKLSPCRFCSWWVRVLVQQMIVSLLRWH